MTNDHVFPEDRGTGAEQGDAADAANFGAFGQHDLLSDYKASGLNLNVDYQSLTFDVSSGKAFVKDDIAATAQNGELRDHGVVYEVEVSSRAALALSDDSINEVYLNLDLTTDDAISYFVTTNGSTPPEPYMKMAEVDTIENTLDQSFNRNLDLTSLDLVDGDDVIWDSSNSEIPDSALGTVENSTLANDSIEVSSGNALIGGGNIELGGSTTLSVGQDEIAINELDTTITPTWTGLHTFNGGITGLPSPDTDSDAATKVYVDSVAEGLDVKEEVLVCTCGTGEIDLTSSTDPNPIDGITLSDGDRILLIEQTDSIENGIYVANTATDPSTWTRAPDADEDAELSTGMFTFTIAGDNNANVGFILITEDPITLGTTPLEFARFSGAESLNVGPGLSKAGNEIFHSDTSSQTDISVDVGSAITDLNFDQFGHVTSATGTDFDSRYYNVNGDSLSGLMDVSGNNIQDAQTVIWNSSQQYVPASSIQQGPGSGLDADTVDGVQATDLGSNISNNGSTVTNSATDIDFRENLEAVDDGDSTSTISLSDPPSLSRGINFSNRVIEEEETFEIKTSDSGLVNSELKVEGTLNIDGSLKIN